MIVINACVINAVRFEEVTLRRTPCMGMTAEFALLHSTDEGVAPKGACKINGFPTPEVMEKAQEFVTALEAAVAAIYEATPSDESAATQVPHKAGLPEF